MVKNLSKESSDTLFPRKVCAAALGELSAWTSVQAILAATRIIEGREAPGDQPSTVLLMPFEDVLNFESVFMQLVDWFIESYRVPIPKLALARSVDPQIRNESFAFLEALRVRPTIRSAAPGLVAGLPPNQRVLIIEDHAATIEVIQGPLRCLMGIALDAYATPASMHHLRVEAKRTTGGAPTIFHQPYADSRLFGVIEALCFYLLGLEVGLRWGAPGTKDLDLSYRAVNVCAVPPIDPQLLDIANNQMRVILDGIR
jgi:hypothetical protein